MTVATPVLTRYSVESIVQSYLSTGKTFDTVETIALKRIKELERAGVGIVWPQFSYYEQEAAIAATVRPNGRKNPNGYDRYLIRVLASRLSTGEAEALNTSSTEASSYTSDDCESKYSPEVASESFIQVGYRPWTNPPGQEWMNWPKLFLFAAKLIHRSYGQYIHYESDFEDLMQEAWVAVWTKAVPTYDPGDAAQFSTYAHAVIRNHLIDVIRKENRRRELTRTELIAEHLPDNAIKV